MNNLRVKLTHGLVNGKRESELEFNQDAEGKIIGIKSDSITRKVIDDLWDWVEHIGIPDCKVVSVEIIKKD